MSKLDLFAPHREQYQEDEAKHDGPQFWRSLEHKAKSNESVELIDAEFPHGALAPAYETDDDKCGVDRRDMMKIMGATMALGAGAGCIRRPEEHIVPYVKMPENMIPGIANYYASALPSPYGAVGILVESHEGRPTKIEGNPDHPESRGKIGVQGHSNMLELYDPDRTRAQQGDNNVWKMWDRAWSTFTSKHVPAGGAGLAFLMGTDESPALDAQIKKVKAKYPSAKFYRYDALSPDNQILGTEMVFGPGVRAHADLSKANVIVALDGDVLNDGPEHLSHAAGFAAGRSFDKIPSAKDAKKMNRLYAVESSFTVTGSSADNRMRVPSNQMGEFLKALAGALSISGVGSSSFKGSNPKFVPALAKDLAANRGKSVILVGEKQPAAVHALAHVINDALGATGKVVRLTKAKEPKAHVSGIATLKQLSADITSGSIKTLVTIGTNPVYTAPASMKLEEAFKKVPYSVHVGLYNDETAHASKVHLPLAHSLESWGDTLAWDGTYSVVQPLIMPLHDGRSALEVMSQFAGTTTAPRDLVLGSLGGNATKILHDGIGVTKLRDTVNMSANSAKIAGALSAVKTFEGTELVIETSPKLLDGRRANLSWNQELPHPMSKLTWDNALLVSPKLARKMGITSKIDQNAYSADVVTVKTDAGSVDVPAFVMPGIEENTVVMHRGYGRKHGGYIADGIGVDSAAVTPADGAWFTKATLSRVGKSQTLVCTQDHFSVDGKPFQDIETLSTTKSEMIKKPAGRTEILARGATAAEYAKKPEFAHDADIPGNLIELKRLSKKGVQRREAIKKANRKLKPNQKMENFKVLPADSSRPTGPKRGLQAVSIDPHKEAWTYDEFQSWGMTIDLTTCIGCNACTIACQSENNIPSVGRESVSFGRELHWIRVDRYFEGDVDEPKAKSQPVPCMHCENAPCEPVCPFAATVHDAEGLNAMVYNRCAGTRYCLNNCPYKVRRYNYFDFSKTAHLYVEAKEKERHEVLKMARNPNVSVRFRGVMEKCTYCTQRIQAAKFAAKRKSEDHRNLPDGAVTPACAQSCPTSAIEFGNINDKTSRVAKRKVADRNYEMLSELNIRPRTTYLAQIKNPNPELV